MGNSLDLGELVKRAIKYLIEGLVVAVASFVIPKHKINLEEVIIIALVAAATFSVLDVFIPSMGASARGGAGFGLGTGLVGGLRVA